MKNIKVGFLGDGQLAQMSAKAALDLGFGVAFYGQNADGPCADLGEIEVGPWDDTEKIEAFAKKVDVLTLENEFVDHKLLEKIESLGTKVYPSSKTFQKIENKHIEKQTFKALNLPVAEYIYLEHPVEDIQKFAKEHDFPLMLKSSKGGYDGYGNRLVNNLDEAVSALEKLGKEVICEKVVNFEREVAVTVARNPSGKIVVYPVCDTIQDENICNLVCSPSNIDENLAQEVQDMAKRAMEGIEGVGVFSFEFFITKDAKILINESAPRPHNSAHYTMDACETSQFYNHILAITDQKLGSTAMLHPRAVMLNILGTQDGPSALSGIDAFSSAKDVHFHIYGKKLSRVGRKMGHVNLVGRSREQLIKLAKFIESTVRI